MELIRISDRKVKIMLTPTDMSHFELDADRLEQDLGGRRSKLRHLLDEIRRQSDFDADEHCLSVQYFPSREGGCEMFICNLRENDSSLPYRQEAPKTALQPIRKGGFRRDCAYRFATLSDLLCACRRLVAVGYDAESAVYRDEHGVYFLFFTVLTASPFSMPPELEFLVEYGSLENAAILRLYICEHASLIAEPNAVHRLAELC